MVKVRLVGMPEDVALVTAVLAATLRVVEESRNYPNRGGELVRRYVTVLPELVQEYPLEVVESE